MTGPDRYEALLTLVQAASVLALAVALDALDVAGDRALPEAAWLGPPPTVGV